MRVEGEIYVLDSDVVLKHSLVPEHKIMSDSAVERLLKKFNVTKEHLPRIKSTDPVAKAIGAKKGQVVEIIRDSITAGKAETYRIVV
jgi:DNA-directed RNA polymerase subunit H